VQSLLLARVLATASLESARAPAARTTESRHLSTTFDNISRLGGTEPRPRHRAALAINAAIFEPSQVTDLCDTNDPQLCDVQDILGANAKIFGAEAYCERYPTP
jgi:hypothetical protein